MSKKVVIAGACRTAIGKMGGALSTTPAPVLGSIVIKEALNRAGVPADQVELTLPAAVTLRENCNALNNFIFDLCHDAKPAFIFVCYHNKGSGRRFQQVEQK